MGLPADKDKEAKLDQLAMYDNKIPAAPKPPVGDYRPGMKRIYLTDEEVRNIPTKGIPYGEAASKDKQGRVYTSVPNKPSQELQDWAKKYNAKIPGWDSPTAEALLKSPQAEPMPDREWERVAFTNYLKMKVYEDWFFGK